MDTETKILLFGVVCMAVYFFYRTWLLPIFAQNALKRQYQSATEPTIILQFAENDDEFWAKVQRERARYEGSGNRWALKQSPVIPFPFNMEFSFTWFDEKFSVSTVGLGKREYLAAAIRQYDQCLKEWQKQTGKEFGFDATFQANGQKAFEGDLWANKPNAN